jgi:acyl-CoA thioesterase FadM
MARISIDLPDSFPFSTEIPVRITDLNYGGHVGNDSVLTLIHEARMQYLRYFGYSELDFGGVSLIMADAGIEFKSELFYNETVIVSVTAGDFSKIGFDLYYKLEKGMEGGLISVAKSKTGMICYDYKNKKIVAVPGEVKSKLTTGNRL